jgi:hypothetical protein
MLRQSRLTGNDRLPARLLGRIDHVAKYAAGAVDLLEIDLLDEIEPQFVTHDLARNKEDGSPVSVGLEYAVDEMQAAGAATSGYSRQVACRLRFSLRRECTGLLVPHGDPLDAASRERARDMIEGITYDTVTMLDARALQRLNDDICNLLAHGIGPLLASRPQHGPGRGAGLVGECEDLYAVAQTAHGRRRCPL